MTLAAGASHTLTLASSMSAIGQAHATVTKEVPQIGVTNNKWSIETDDTMFDLYDSAHSETITPAATTGETTLTLSSGSWAAEDVGRRVTGNGGEAVVTAVASAVADITVITDFTDTSPITSGNWQMYAGMFKEGAFSLSGFEAVDWDAWDGTADGVAAVFESATTGYISSVALDSTRVLVCYRDTGNSNYGTAIVLTANSDNTISTGTPAVYEPLNSTDYNSVCKVATDKALVCYNSPSQGKANVLSISGTSITVGTQAEFNSNTVSYVSVCEIGTDKALVCFTDSGGLHYGKARVLECYGTTTITAGTLSSYANATTLYHSVAHLDVDKAVVCFATGTTGYSAVLTITGTSIANGALSTFESAAVSFVSVAALSSTKAVVCYTDNGNSSHGTAVVLDISGTTVTPGTPVEYTSVAATYHSTVKIAESLIFVGYNDLTGTGCVLAITGGSVIPEAPVDFNAVISEHMSITLLDSGHIVASYQDAGNSDHGTSKVLNALSATYAADQFAVAMTNASGEINSEYFTDLNSFTPSDTLYGQSAFYGISMDGTTFEIVGDGETTLRNVVRFNTVWEYNSNATYGSETWTSASIDDPNVAVKEALSLTQNQMNSATAAAVLDATWPAFGSIFGVFIALKSTDSTKTPTVEKIDFNYDGQIKNVEKTHE
ncbi:hypothetical protein KAR91_64855, partial [Candidatus Pacearchaeota archaeon]|nr:hypothetical protein [Candidatus Pacearchaeota archaeon]